MHFGADFFKILNIVVTLMRMFAGIFGDEDDKKAVDESVTRTKDANPDHVC